MTVKLVGDFPEIKRFMTNMYSFDRAFVNYRGDLGMPIGTAYELYGVTHVGKSTFAYSLAGILANGAEIALCDFEGFDPITLTHILEGVRFDGTLTNIAHKEDESQLDQFIDKMWQKETRVGILDSIAAISPISEQKGDMGDANMGRRAKLTAVLVRKCCKLFRFAKHDITLLMTNHMYPIVGGRGWITPGGEVKKYLATVRINLSRVKNYPDGSYILQGVVKKNRWGFEGRTFYVFLVSELGIHLGLTAMYDCLALKKAEANKTVKMGDKSFGYIKDLVKKAREKDDAFFMPFFEALNTHDNEETISSTNMENECEEITTEDENDTDTSFEQ